MKNQLRYRYFLGFIGLCFSFSTYAAKSSVESDISSDPSSKEKSKYAIVPYVFGSDSLGTAAGVAGLVRGVGQEQASLLGAAFYTNKDSYMFYFSANNYRLGHNWLFTADAYQGDFMDYEYYVGDATSNDSDKNDYIKTDGFEARYRLHFTYAFPIAEGKKKGAAALYNPTNDNHGYFPWESGVTSFEFQPFYRERDLSDVKDSDLDSTWGANFGLEWDNRDDIRSPTSGSHTKMNYTYAPDQGDQDSWSTFEFQNSQYWNLGAWDNVFDQQVLAFDFYTATTPNWEDCDDDTCHRPPEYAGVKLGGLYHLRGYSTGRYTGKAAIHYSMEYRVIPKWQPLDHWPVFKWYDIPWWQWVVFADAGRVADKYNFKDLNSDMKWSAGGGIRFQVEGVVVRTEMVWSEEDSIFRVMVNQPF